MSKKIFYSISLDGKIVSLPLNFVIMLFGSKNNKLTSNTTKISNYVR